MMEANEGQILHTEGDILGEGTDIAADLAIANEPLESDNGNIDSEEKSLSDEDQSSPQMTKKITENGKSYEDLFDIANGNNGIGYFKRDSSLPNSSQEDPSNKQKFGSLNTKCEATQFTQYSLSPVRAPTIRQQNILNSSEAVIFPVGSDLPSAFLPSKKPSSPAAEWSEHKHGREKPNKLSNFRLPDSITITSVTKKNRITELLPNRDISVSSAKPYIARPRKLKIRKNPVLSIIPPHQRSKHTPSSNILSTIDLTKEDTTRKPTNPRKKVVCQVCDKEFLFLEELNSHMGCHRKKIRKFKCSVCSALYYTEAELKAHFKKYHDDGGHIMGDIMAIPVVDLNDPDSVRKLMEAGFRFVIPLSKLAGGKGDYTHKLSIIGVESAKNPAIRNVNCPNLSNVLTFNLPHVNWKNN